VFSRVFVDGDDIIIFLLIAGVGWSGCEHVCCSCMTSVNGVGLFGWVAFQAGAGVDAFAMIRQWLMTYMGNWLSSTIGFRLFVSGWHIQWLIPIGGN